jgi:hypothetical protein
MPQIMEAPPRQAGISHDAPEGPAQVAIVQGMPRRAGEHQAVVRIGWPQLQPPFSLDTPMVSQDMDRLGRERDRAAPTSCRKLG